VNRWERAPPLSKGANARRSLGIETGMRVKKEKFGSKTLMKRKDVKQKKSLSAVPEQNPQKGNQEDNQEAGGSSIDNGCEDENWEETFDRMMPREGKIDGKINQTV